MAKIDWSKAGTRLRRTPNEFGRNPDWNDAAQRWKTADEYAGEEIGPNEVAALASCPTCHAAIGERCSNVLGEPMVGPHWDRRRAAGAARIAAGEFAL